MEKLQTNTKKTRSILRIPKRKDIFLSIALFLVSRAGILGGFPLAVPFFAALCDSSASYIYIPVLLLGLISTGANSIKYFLASLIFWLISELRLRQAGRFTNAIYCAGLIFLSGLFEIFSSSQSIIFLIAESIISAVAYYAFTNVKSFFSKYKRTVFFIFFSIRIAQESTSKVSSF